MRPTTRPILNDVVGKFDHLLFQFNKFLKQVMRIVAFASQPVQFVWFVIEFVEVAKFANKLTQPAQFVSDIVHFAQFVNGDKFLDVTRCQP